MASCRDDLPDLPRFVLDRLRKEGMDIERNIKFEHTLTPLEWRDK